MKRTYQVKLNNEASMQITFSDSLPKKKTFDGRCAKTRNDNGRSRPGKIEITPATKGHEGYRITLQTNSVPSGKTRNTQREGEGRGKEEKGRVG